MLSPIQYPYFVALAGRQFYSCVGLLASIFSFDFILPCHCTTFVLLRWLMNMVKSRAVTVDALINALMR